MKLLITPLLASAAVSILSAQTLPSEPAAAQSAESHLRGTARCKASQLIGRAVTNTKNESLGEIQDIVLDGSNRRIAYAVLASGGFLGMGETYFAMPWRLLEVGQRGTEDMPTVTLGLDKATLKSAPGFNKAKWPDMADNAWATRVDDYYRLRNETARPASNAPAPKGTALGGQGGVDRAPSDKVFLYRRLSKLIGMTVVNGESTNLASVEDLIVDTSAGKVDGAVLGFGGMLGIGEHFALVPVEALTIDHRNNVMIFRCTKAKFEAMALPGNKLPALNDEVWLVKSRVMCADAIKGQIRTDGDVLVVDASGVVPVPFADSYDTTKTETVEGTIVTVGSVRIGDRHEERVRLRIRSAAGHEVIVYAAPTTFADQQALGLRTGKTIEVTGSPARYADQTVLVAGSIVSGKNSAVLRDGDGHVTWKKKD